MATTFAVQLSIHIGMKYPKVKMAENALFGIEIKLIVLPNLRSKYILDLSTQFMVICKFLKSVHFKKTVARISFLLKLRYFLF